MSTQFGMQSQAEFERQKKALDDILADLDKRNSQKQQTTLVSQSSQPQSQSPLNFDDIRKMWDMGFDQRQREADKNAERAFKFRDLESIRNFGQEKDLSKQGFEQDRTIRGDELSSIERREAAQAQARERLADVNQRLQQRQQESERSAAMSVFSAGRRR